MMEERMKMKLENLVEVYMCFCCLSDSVPSPVVR